MEFIKNSLYKNWIESFYDFVQDLGGITGEVMSKILEFEADQTVLTITKNSFNIKTSELSAHDKYYELYPKIGQLVVIQDELSEIKEEEKLKEKLQPFPEYLNMYSSGDSLLEQFKKKDN